MGTLKLTSWNVEHLDRLVQPNLSAPARRRRDAVAQEIRDLNPDVLCLLEGPAGETAMEKVCKELLGNRWRAVKAADGQYATKGKQWIWFLVKENLLASASLLPPATWDALTRPRWPVFPWGQFAEESHSHYRHPQVLVLNSGDLRVEFIGLHLKSKFVNEGKRLWNGSDAERQTFIREALSARMKLATEAANVREYIEARFAQVPNPAIFVLGDLNDGPGKEYFEERYLFFDLVANLQGDVFFASRFLNHALFDFPDPLRWSVYFQDFVEPGRNPRILLDHILFTQGLVNGSLPWQVNAGAGKVEHEVHDLINATLPAAAKTSDHKPISVSITTP
jgi:hypothetical protein